MNYPDFIRNRITELRIKKDVSEYQMSLDLGHSKSYIQGISSGRALPSMNEFISICDYLGISPKEFFNDEVQNPIMLKKLISAAENLQDSEIELLLNIIEKFK